MNDKDIYRAWMPKTQKRTVTVAGPALPMHADGAPVFLLSSIKGREAFSTLYRYELLLTTSLDVPEALAASIDIASLIARLPTRWATKAGNAGMRDSRSYRYDPASRLTAVSAGRASETFAYDPAGNLLAVGHGTITHHGMARGDRLLSLVTPEHPEEQPPQYTYDGHGNRTAIMILGASEAAATRYRYDGTHQLKGIDYADGSTSRYEYDALGRRTAKHVTDSTGSTATTLFVWDGDWMAQEIRTGNGKLTPVTYVVHPDHAGPLTKLDGAQAYHYATDHLGTPQEVYDEQRQIVWAADLSAYGKMRRYLTHEIDNPIRFPGQYFDAESGLHYNRFRYYDPQAARYISQDPIGLSSGPNLYAYVRGNPLSYFDPYGLSNVDVYIWRAEGSSVGHVMVTDADSTQVILSQFPSNGYPLGPNETKSFADTMAAEGRPASEIWRINVPNDEAFNTAAARERGLKIWSWDPSKDTTQCSIAASRALKAGGVKLNTITTGTLMPGFFANGLHATPGVGTRLR